MITPFLSPGRSTSSRAINHQRAISVSTKSACHTSFVPHHVHVDSNLDLGRRKCGHPRAFSHVWHHIKLQDFANFWTALKSSEVVKDVSKDTDVIKWTFKDGTILEVKQEEHSVSLRHRSIASRCSG